jgi:hypothetical protein
MANFLFLYYSGILESGCGIIVLHKIAQCPQEMKISLPKYQSQMPLGVGGLVCLYKSFTLLQPNQILLKILHWKFNGIYH